MNRKIHLGLVLTITQLLLVHAGCDNTPTVPVPPPEMVAIDVSVTTPDTEGYSTVAGETTPVAIGYVIMVFNESSGRGIMDTIDRVDGSFEVKILAEVDDLLVVQLKNDDKLSQQTEFRVPSR